MLSARDERPGLSVPEAAAAIGISEATVRRDIARGAPTLEPGAAGRGKGARIDVRAYVAWRSGAAVQRGDDEVLDRLADGIRALFASEYGNFGMPAHAVVGLLDRDAAALYVEMFKSCTQRLIGRIPGVDELPTTIKDLIKIAGETARR